MIHLYKQLLARPTLTNISTLFAGTAFARVISALVIFIIARQLGLEKFGLFTAALSLAKLSSIFFSLGLDSWLLRYAGQYEERLGIAAGSALVIKGVLGSIWLLVLFFASPVLPQSSFVRELVILSAFSVFFEELGNTGLSVFKASLRNHITVRLLAISQTLLLLVTLLLVGLGSEDTAAFLGVRVFSTGIGALITLVSVFRVIKVRVNSSSVYESLRGTYSFGLSHGLAIIYERADITIIAFFLGKVAAGIYSPAISLMTTLFLVPTAVYEVLLPVLSQKYAHNKKAIPSINFKLFLLSAALGIFLGLSMAIMAYPLVMVIYSSEFAESAPILIILSNVLLFKCLSFALAASLAAVGWQGKRVLIQLVSATVNIGLNLLVVNNFGIHGVAYVYVLTEFILTVGYLGLFLQWQSRIVQS